MAEAAEVIQMEDQIIVKEFGIEELAAANVALMKKQILEIPETPETKEQYEKAYRFHVDSKSLLPRIEERRKELKAPVLKKGKDIDATAKKAVAMVNPLIELAGSRRAKWEEIKNAEIAEKERQEANRIGEIQGNLVELKELAGKYQQYNRTAESLARDLAHLESYEISAVDFQEFTEEAEQIKSAGIAATETALENRKKFEAEQAKLAEEKAKAKAEAKRLAEERAKMEAEQKARDEEARKAAEAEAEKRRQEEERLKAEREALEKEKAAAAYAAIVTEREAFWEIAHQENFDFDHTEALKLHEAYKAEIEKEINTRRAHAKAKWEATEKAREEAAARAKLVEPDQETLTNVANQLEIALSEFKTPKFNTDEAAKLVLDCVAGIRAEIHKLELGARELV